MNYTGFGSDPNFIYSFRGGMATGPAMGSSQFVDRFAKLRNSLVYKQADARGRKRMEQAVEMGLPFNTDINKIQKVGIDQRFGSPIYAAPRPQPWGTWGALGSTQEPSGYTIEEVERMEAKERGRARVNKRARGGRGPSILASNEEKKAYSQIQDEIKRRAIRSKNAQRD